MKSYLRGFVHFGRAGSTVECVVHDISGTGARLKVFGPPPMVDIIKLQIPIKGRIHHAKVLWGAAHEVGVAFIEAATAPAARSEVDDLSNRIIRQESEIVALKRTIQRLQSALPPLRA